MPGTPKPVGQNGPYPPHWNAVMQALGKTQQQASALASGAPAGWVVDQWGNVTELSGTNLNQIVTIGAAYQQAGVSVGTGIASGTAGRAAQSGPAITTITVTKGSTSATAGIVSKASLAIGQSIGAANVNDPSSGIATPAITPGTTIAGLSGASVTLSQAAAESGTALYCAAARYIVQQDTGWLPITLASGFGTLAGYNTPSVRIVGDSVRMRGAITVNSGSASTWGTVPSPATPLVVVGLGANVSNSLGQPTLFGGVDASGHVISGGTTGVGYVMYLEGLTYSLS